MLSFSTAKHGDATVIALAGDLDTTAAQELDQQVERAMLQLDATLILDVALLEYLNSTGVRSFVKADRQLKAQGRGLVIRGATHRFLRILRYCGLETYFSFEPAPDVTMASLREKGS